jgi:hypothetical protein
VQVFEEKISRRGWLLIRGGHLLSTHARKNLIFKVGRGVYEWRCRLKGLTYLLELFELVLTAGAESEMALNLGFLL